MEVVTVPDEAWIGAHPDDHEDVPTVPVRAGVSLAAGPDPLTVVDRARDLGAAMATKKGKKKRHCLTSCRAFAG